MTDRPSLAGAMPRGPFAAIAGLVLVLVAALLLREVASLVVPVVFGLFLALVAWPLVTLLQRRGVRSGVALAIAIGLVVVVLLAVTVVFVSSIRELVDRLPDYQDRATGQIEAVLAFLGGLGVRTDPQAILALVSPSAVAAFLRPIASAVSEAGIALFIIVVTLLYALAGAGSLQARARAVFGERHILLAGVEQFGVDLRRYLLVRALLGLFAAVAILVVLVVLSVPLPVLWAFLVFAASFIPNIGTLIALVPTTVLALLDGGPATAVLVLVAYTIINFVQDHFLQPVVMGAELNLTPLVVFLAVVGWAWILGAAGALLAVPLTVGMVAIMESYPESRPWAALLRNRVGPAAATGPDGDVFTAPGSG